MTGSTRYKWEQENGIFDFDGKPMPKLLASIANAEWDVMTWGPYFKYRPEFYACWVDFCLQYHPDMKFRVDFPEGWRTVNTRSAVVGISQGEDAIVQITGTPKATARAAADAFFGQEGVAGGADWKSDFNGLTGVSRQFKATTQQGEIQGMVAFIELDEIVLKITGMSAPDLWSDRKEVILASMGSFRKLTNRKWLDVEPARVRVVMVGRARTLDEVAREFDATVPADIIARMNDLKPGDTVQPGTRIKLVVGGKLP